MRFPALQRRCEARRVECADGWCGYPSVDFSWMDRSVCSPDDTWRFFPGGANGKTALAEAKEMCGDCPVREACLEYAISTGQRYGIWAGRTPRQLAGYRKLRAAS